MMPWELPTTRRGYAPRAVWSPLASRLVFTTTWPFRLLGPLLARPPLPAVNLFALASPAMVALPLISRAPNEPPPTDAIGPVNVEWPVTTRSWPTRRLLPMPTPPLTTSAPELLPAASVSFVSVVGPLTESELPSEVVPAVESEPWSVVPPVTRNTSPRNVPPVTVSEPPTP